MSAVPSTTAPASRLATLWNNKNYFLLAGLGLVLLIAYRYLNRKTPIDSRPPPPDLPQRSIARVFPHCGNALQILPFDKVAQGIIRINLKDLGLVSKNPLDPVVIECRYNGSSFFSMPMSGLATLEAYIPHLPHAEKIFVYFSHQQQIFGGVELSVDQVMGIYEIYIENSGWKIESHPEALPTEVAVWPLPPYNADDALALSITNNSPDPTNASRTRPIKAESHYSIQNTTHKVHLIFFEIAGKLDGAYVMDLRFVVPLAVFPGTTTLPQRFLRTCWEHTFRTVHGKEPPVNPRLDIMRTVDCFAAD